MPSILFFIFSGIAVFAACSVVLVKNPVKSVLSLILCFIGTAATWLMLEAEFLAWILILVYVGAVMVLFLFVVMMLDVKFATLRARYSRWIILGLLVAGSMVVVLMALVAKDGFVINKHLSSLAYGPKDVSNAKLLGEYVFSEYLLQFEVAGVILLAAIIAAIGLVYRGPRDRKVQNIPRQIKADPRDRVQLVEGN